MTASIFGYVLDTLFCVRNSRVAFSELINQTFVPIAMRDLGKHICFFIVAAAIGGGLAYFIGLDEPFQLRHKLGAAAEPSQTVLQSEDWRGKKASEAIAATPQIKPTQAQVTVPAASPLASHEGGMPVKTQDKGMLEILRSLKHSGNERSASDDQRAQQRLQSALEELRAHLQKSELARAIVSRRDTEGVISTMAKISPPTASEVNTLKELLNELQMGLPPQQLMQFQNQSLNLLRQFIFAQDKFLVVFVTQQFAQADSKSGNFHSHLTTKPNEYWHHHNGERIGVPQGETTFEGGPVATPLSLDFRYYHLASAP
jgi:hypothetical protein